MIGSQSVGEMGEVGLGGGGGQQLAASGERSAASGQRPAAVPAARAVLAALVNECNVRICECL